MRVHLTAVAWICLMTLVGCASILIPDPSTKSPAEQQQDRAECAAVAARAAQDYAWDPLADLEAVRTDREAECLESRGYAITTKVYMRPSAEGDQAGQAHPDPVRRCYQQAYAWLGRYDGPVDGRANVIWRAAQVAYLTELQVTSSRSDAPNLMQEAIRRDLRALGRVDEWQACLQEARKSPQ
jgi:hypothetical protein